MLLQQMMAAQQRDEALLALVSTQKALSQRVVFLASAADDATRAGQAGADRLAAARPPPNSRRTTTCCSSAPAPIPTSPARLDPNSIESVLFAKPFHLDYFSIGLAANGWRFISALRDRARHRRVDAGYLAGKERARLDETVANATLAGYTALGDRINALANARLDEHAQHPPDAVLSPPSASSSWSRCSSSGRCRT